MEGAWVVSHVPAAACLLAKARGKGCAAPTDVEGDVRPEWPGVPGLSRHSTAQAGQRAFKRPLTILNLSTIPFENRPLGTSAAALETAARVTRESVFRIDAPGQSQESEARLAAGGQIGDWPAVTVVHRPAVAVEALEAAFARRGSGTDHRTGDAADGRACQG